MNIQSTCKDKQNFVNNLHKTQYNKRCTKDEHITSTCENDYNLINNLHKTQYDKIRTSTIQYDKYSEIWNTLNMNEHTLY